ncbi:BatD family protein [Myxococcaceae bacterium GXIMD 01537]
MRRTGRGRAAVCAVLALLATAPAWAADIEFYQSVDRTEVGTEDTFRLSVVSVDAPPSAQVQVPRSDDFEVLSSSRSSQRSIQLSGGGPAVIQDVTKYVYVMRASRPGKLTLPPSVMTADGRTYRTESINMTVRSGRVSPPRGQANNRQALPDPFRNFPMPDPFADSEDAEEDLPTGVPRGDSDLFLRSSLDKDEVYVGEQVTLSLYIYSRVDLSSVDSVTMPKLEGFWSEEVENPTQLSSEQRVINGIPYRAYLLRRRALFPVKPGTVSISSAEADITTGFLFAGHRVHRVANALKVKVRPLPAGAPPGFVNANVGSWNLSVDVTQTRVELGQPVTVKVILDGVGNVKNVSPPKLTAPEAFKVYDPTTTDRLTPGKGKVQGRRVVEYLVMPQRTGTFTLPGLEFPYFDPRAGRYEVARTEPITLTVEAGAGGVASPATVPTHMADSANSQKNVLSGGGLRPLRYQARFEAPATPLWLRPFFLPAVLAPLGLLLAAVVLGQVRGKLLTETEAGRSRQRAKAARKRLAAAEKLQKEGAAGAFYGEVEKALLDFVSARLGAPVVGLTRDALAQKLEASGVAEERRKRVLFVLEACDMGRFGGAELSGRERVLDDAAEAMEGWDK